MNNTDLSKSNQHGYEYELIIDRPGSRAVLMEALENTKKRLIIVCPWLSTRSIDTKMIQKFQTLLQQNVRIDIGWGHLGDMEKGQLGKGSGYSALEYLRKLERDYPAIFRLKLLGTHEKFLVCDRTFAMLGSHNMLTSDDDRAEREVGIRTTNPSIIEGLINRFDDAPDLEAQDVPTPPSLCDLKNQYLGCLHNLDGHSSMVWCLAISPDGQTLASGSGDEVAGENTINIWNLRNGKLIRCISGHSALVKSVAISPDAQTLVSGSWDKSIKLWNLKTGELIKTLTEHSGKVEAVVISPDGQTIASGSQDNTIKLWDLATGKLLHTLIGHSHHVNSLAVSPDGEFLASGSFDGTIKLWDLVTGKLLHTLAECSGCTNSIAISPDGQLLVSSGSWHYRETLIEIWNLKQRRLLHAISMSSSKIYPVESVAISPNGQILAGSCRDKRIRLWNLQTGELLRTFKSGHRREISAVAFNLSGMTFVSGSLDKRIKIWRVFSHSLPDVSKKSENANQ